MCVVNQVRFSPFQACTDVLVSPCVDSGSMKAVAGRCYVLVLVSFFSSLPPPIYSCCVAASFVTTVVTSTAINVHVLVHRRVPWLKSNYLQASHTVWT